MRCENGHENADGQRYCGECGAHLESGSLEPSDSWWQAGATPRKPPGTIDHSSVSPGRPLVPSAAVAVKIKKYPNAAAANRDARRMAAEGWEPQGMAGGGTRLSLGKGIVNKGIASAALGPLGLFASSRVEQPVTITWTRTPEASAAAARRRDDAAAAAAKRRADAAARRLEAARLREETKARNSTSKREAAVAEEAAKQELKQAKQLARQEKALGDTAARAEKENARQAAKQAKALAKESKRDVASAKLASREAARVEQEVSVAGQTEIANARRESYSPPAWHPDPHGQARLRWWDGTKWTTHTSP
jgi:hypothetical protein